MPNHRQAVEAGQQPEMAEFSKWVSKKAEAQSDIVNVGELMAWLESIAEDKLGGLHDEGRGEGHEVARAEKAARWLATCGRKSMLRNGLKSEWRRGDGKSWGASGEPQWVGKAAAEGRALSKLTLSEMERTLLEEVMDWMAAPDGPSMGADWSRMTIEQAKAGELAWIEEKAKAAEKMDMDAADAAGTEAVLSLDGVSGFEGWKWVEVFTQEALNREGAMMKNCVGSFAKKVEEGAVAIYSLRDQDNKPKLTLEASASRLAQLKGFANGPCPAELSKAVDAVVEMSLGKLAAGAELSLSKDFEAAGWKSFGRFGVVKKGDLGSEPVKEMEALLDLDSESWGDGWDLTQDPVMLMVDAFFWGAGAGPSAAVSMVEHLRSPDVASKVLSKAAKAGNADASAKLMAACEALGPERFENDCYRALQAVCAFSGNVEVAKKLLPFVSSGKFCEGSNGDNPMEEAAGQGHMEVMEAMLEAMPNLDCSKALFRAVNGDSPVGVDLALAKARMMEVVAMLVPRCASKENIAWRGKALESAASRGDAKLVQMLLPVSDPMGNDCKAFLAAARLGHAEVMELLAPMGDPKTHLAMLKKAGDKGHEEVVGILLPLVDPKDAKELADVARRVNKGEAPPRGHCDMTPRVRRAIIEYDEKMEAQGGYASKGLAGKIAAARLGKAAEGGDAGAGLERPRA